MTIEGVQLRYRSVMGGVCRYFLPTIPAYLPEHYRMLLKEIIAKSAKNNMHFAGNIDLSIPRSPTTVYLQDRLQEQLELMDLQVASSTPA